MKLCGLFFRLGNVRKDKELQLNQAYEFHESDMKHGVKKTLTVQLWGCEKWAMEFAPKPGELMIDLLKKGVITIVQTIYYSFKTTINNT